MSTKEMIELPDSSKAVLENEEILKAANELVISGPEARNDAFELLSDINLRRKQIVEDLFGPPRKAAFGLHKWIKAAENRVLADLDKAEDIIRGKDDKYRIEAEQKLAGPVGGFVKLPLPEGWYERTTWGNTVVDMRSFVAWCLESGNLRLLEVKDSALNKIASESKGTMQVPGITFTPNVGIVERRPETKSP